MKLCLGSLLFQFMKLKTDDCEFFYAFVKKFSKHMKYSNYGIVIDKIFSWYKFFSRSHALFIKIYQFK